MQVRYRNTVGDIVALQKMVLRHTLMGRKILFHRFLVVEAVLLLICLLLMTGHPPGPVMPFFVGFSALAWGFRERPVIRKFTKDLKAQLVRDPEAAFRRETTMTVSEEGLEVANSGAAVTHPWPRVEYVGRDDRYTYVLTDGLRHYAVPAAAFGGDAEADRFWGEIRRRFEGSRRQAA